jgi:aryl sulfotransferase
MALFEERYWGSAYPGDLRTLSDTSKLHYLSAVLSNAVKLERGSVWIKTHDAKEMQGISLQPQSLTKAAAYVVRDPRDVAPSFAAYKGCSIDEAIEQMNKEHYLTKRGSHGYQFGWEYLSTWSGHVKSWIVGHPNTMVVKYEDLHQDAACILGTLADLFEAKGVVSVEQAVEMCEFAKMQKQEQENGFPEGEQKSGLFFRSGKVGGYKDVLTDEQIERIESDHGEVMKLLGYEIGVQCG